MEAFFNNREVELFGLSPGDFIRSVSLALDQAFFSGFGFTLAEADHLHLSRKPWRNPGRQRFLLLPYCAKRPDCDYRFRRLRPVRACSIGAAYALAADQVCGSRPSRITSTW